MIQILITIGVPKIFSKSERMNVEPEYKYACEVSPHV